MRQLLRLVIGLLVAVVLVVASPAAHADNPLPNIPGVPLPSIPGVGVPGLSDCKEAPTPDSPGNGLAGFFGREPDRLPPPGDPFKAGSGTTIYEQYGYAGLRWRTYDLGCGPDAVRNPDAVVGTAVSNWVMQIPIALTALTGSLTQVAFKPTFLDSFDPAVEQVSTALHDNLFASWIPVVLALLGFGIIFMARRQALASTASAIAWALMVVIIAAALFRWPVAAGQVADSTVTATIGQAVGHLDGDSTTTDPGMAVSSQVQEAILYRAWLAGTLGSPDSPTARTYGPALFKAQALTWREAAESRRSPDRAKAIIEAKQQQWADTADKIKEADPEAYENLTGQRSETRVGYSLIAAVGTLLSLPFLMLSALLMLGCFLIVRLAVMLFPAFAVLGIFPASRGLVTGLGKTVAAAVVNSIIFGIGAGVTVAVLGLLFHPDGGSPAWLSLVLMPLFSFIMWHALKPFRRLTSMVSPSADHFANASGSLGTTVGSSKKLALAGLAAVTGGATAAATTAAANKANEQRGGRQETERAEARPSLEESETEGTTRSEGPEPTQAVPRQAAEDLGRDPAESTSWTAPSRGEGVPSEPAPAAALSEGFVPHPSSPRSVPPPTEPEWYDGEAVYPIYRPETDAADMVVNQFAASEPGRRCRVSWGEPMSTRGAGGAAAVAAVGLVLVIGPALLMTMALMGTDSQTTTSGCSTDLAQAAVDVQPVAGLTASQSRNAAAIVAVGQQLNVPRQGIVVALAAAHQESGFLNYANDGRGNDLARDQTGVGASLRLPHDAVGTDHGSVGVFQQQWPWWGTLTELMTPATAAAKFYNRLLVVPGWQRMPVTQAAQAVQRSAYPGAYADDQALAERLLAREPTTTGGTTQQAAWAGASPNPACSAPDIGAGTVMMPIASSSSYTDLHNFGGSGSRWAHGHTGTDLSATCGTPVVAAHAGTVRIRTDQAWAGPHLVMVSTGPGQLTTWYAHMQSVTVRPGQYVRPGQQIGAVGALGNATGCHLHFEVHPRGGTIYQDDIDPSAWLRTHVGTQVQVRTVAAPTETSTGSVTIASFNVLGYSHTAAGGDRASWASGTVRIRGAIALLDLYGVDVVGLQEFQRPQRAAFLALAGDRYATWHPGRDTENSIAWRRDKFALVSASSLAIPYFHGNTRQMPIVRLRNLQTGTDAVFINVHNPADVHGPAGRFRRVAERRELATARAVATSYGVPVFVTGDFNDRAATFCALTTGGTLSASAGGSHVGRCTPPQRAGIDWIFGTSMSTWAAHSVIRTPRQHGISDHPMVIARASVGEG